jgi:uncharacterized membrane protein YdbT with pleckstrin-like domain
MSHSKQLAHGEYVIFNTHAHWKVLIVPGLILLACLAALAAWIGWAPESIRQVWATWTVGIVLAIVVIVWTLAPLIRWLARTDTLTNMRLISREGVFHRSGRDIPMDRVHAVTVDRTLVDRILGAGTLTVQTAADSSDVVLEAVAHVQRRQLQIQEQFLGIDFPGIGPDSGGV